MLFLKNIKPNSIQAKYPKQATHIKLATITLLFIIILVSNLAFTHAQTYLFSNKWGSFGSEIGQFSNPYDLQLTAKATSMLQTPTITVFKNLLVKENF